MKIQDKKWIVECIWAIKNEIVVDLELYKMFNTDADDFANTPRPSKWLAKFSKNNLLLKIVLRLVRFSWKIGFGTIFSAREAFRFYKMWKNEPEVKLEFNQDVGLGFSERAYELIPVALKKPLDCWIIFPWSGPRKIAASSKQISFISLLKSGDFFHALFLSRKVQKKMAKSSKLSNHIIQSYVSCRWFLVRIALERLNAKSFYTAEHFDRWAVLADRLVAHRSDSTLSLVQHGSLGGLEGGASFPFNLAYRLRNVRHLFTFNKQSEEIFLGHVLKGNSPVISSFNLSIKLEPVKSDKIKVLFIGHTICEEFQIELYQKIMESTEILAFYKPHPLSPPGPKVNQAGWQVITEKSYFPQVDRLVSYPSTLVDEYAIFGVPVTMHSLNAKTEDVGGILLSFTEGIRDFKLNYN